MAMFAETAVVDYHLSFADRGEQTPFLFPFSAYKQKLPFLQQTNGSSLFPLVSSFVR
jgi:hypothetical protein